jgi:SAM-dependent methyltransferase
MEDPRGGPGRADEYVADVTLTISTDDLVRLAAGDLGDGGGSIWRDPYVQRQLLAAHLDQTNPAATRMPGAVARTVQLVLSGLPRGATVLDLGCGPGTYARALAQQGCRVTGVDINAAALEYARAEDAAGIRYVEADYTTAMPTGPFDLVVLIYLDFGTHRPQVQARLLAAIHERLRPGGRLVLDFLDAPAARAHRPGRDWEVSSSEGFWSASPCLVLTETSVDTSVLARRIRYAVFSQAGPRVFDVWEHCFAEASMRALLAESGFASVEFQRGVLDGVDPQSEDVVFAVATA